MNYTHKRLLMTTVTPLHVGCGQEAGVVDLPIIRERATGFPFIPGSGIRGSLREHCSAKDNTLTVRLFGPESGKTSEEAGAGCVAIHDARILFYPVRSDLAIFFWITCPMVLQRYNTDIKVFETGGTAADKELLNFVHDENYAGTGNSPLFLEEYRLEAAANSADLAGKLNTFSKAIDAQLENRCMLVSNYAFHHFTNYATIISQHNALTSAKTVKNGALFSQESLPPETIFYQMLGGTAERTGRENSLKRDEVLPKLKEQLFARNSNTAYFHFGGNESTGMGLTEIKWMEGN